MTRLKYELDNTICITPCPFGMTITYGAETSIRKVGGCVECETCEYYNGKLSETKEVMCNHPVRSKYEIAQEVIEEWVLEDPCSKEVFPLWLERKTKSKKITLLKTMNELITGDISLDDLVITDDPNNPESYRALGNISLEVALDLIKQEKLWYYEKEKE